MLIAGCQQASPAPPPAARPTLKTESDLQNERAARIAAGEVVPTSAPALDTAGKPLPPLTSAPVAPRPEPGAIAGDVLLVNDEVITVAEIIYPLRDEIIKTRKEQTPAGARDKITRLIRELTQREIGAILMFREAVGSLEVDQRKILEDNVKRALRQYTDSEFGGSSARLEAHLLENGLEMERYRKLVERDMVVRQYAREKFMSQLSVRREELLEQYRREIEKYTTPETRELYLIEFPFEKFLPEGERWASASNAAQASARLKASRRAREAYEQLPSRPFEDVAREFSLGANASDGGKFGPIGKPLQPPMDVVSKPVFGFSEGQYGEPIETSGGWYIARCGAIHEAHTTPFSDVQDEIRQSLMERRAGQLTSEHFVKLVSKATVSSIDVFLETALRRAEALPLQ